MKYATKFMMMPYVKPISGGPEDKPTELSNKMSTTLAQKGLSSNDKHKTYSNELSKLNSFLEARRRVSSYSTLIKVP
jgi:hypothetical protein